MRSKNPAVQPVDHKFDALITTSLPMYLYVVMSDNLILTIKMSF